MTGLNHVLTGSAIALAVKQPWLAAPLALALHFVLDAIPHFDHELYQYGSKYFTPIMASDAAISVTGVLILCWLVPSLAFTIIIGALFAILPDFLWLYYYTHNRPQWWFFRFHSKIQWFERPPGALVELSYLIFITTVIIAIK